MQAHINHFNVRVYGLFINNKEEILLSDEYRMNMYMIKFPGGGLKYGEGTIDCLKREAVEEFGQEIEIISHYYTTDFFQKADFFEDHQLISIYYKACFKQSISFPVADKAMDIKPVDGSQAFRWKKIRSLKPNDLTFPIDREVVKMLKFDEQ